MIERIMHTVLWINRMNCINGPIGCMRKDQYNRRSPF